MTPLTQSIPGWLDVVCLFGRALRATAAIRGTIGYDSTFGAA